MNLCPSCRYHPATCAGHPTFAGPKDDRVVECSGYQKNCSLFDAVMAGRCNGIDMLTPTELLQAISDGLDEMAARK